MSSKNVLVCLLIGVLAVSSEDVSAQGELHAVIVAGSTGYGNYRHQADACHAYHVLIGHGVKPENVILMMENDVVNHPRNPHKGRLFNRPQGYDVYENCTIDYQKGSESSWAAYMCGDMGAMLADVFSAHWMEQADNAFLHELTLDQHFEVIKTLTTGSHVSRFGDRSIGKQKTALFLGEHARPELPRQHMNVCSRYDAKAVNVHEVPIRMLEWEIAHTRLQGPSTELKRKLAEIHEKRVEFDRHAEELVAKITASKSKGLSFAKLALDTAHYETVRDLDCHDRAVKTFSRRCFSLSTNPYAMKIAGVLNKLCNAGVGVERIVKQIEEHCGQPAHPRMVTVCSPYGRCIRGSFCHPPTHLHAFSAVRSGGHKTAIQKWGYKYLVRQEASKRPLSPHLSIYKPQLTWCLSGLHRVSGCLMGGTLLVGGLGFALLPLTYAQLIEHLRSWKLPAVVTGGFKFFIAFNVVFYALNGLRLLAFDLAKGTDLISVYRSGWLVLGLSAAISLLVVLNSSKKRF
ncbi:Succinate dehydrogenase cytochrome b560 subunit, mitochondrial [Aphelenchoides fujianensis]|nr:Succinate dehydrogenase cytochrome b560 subunit, mitochondrial [Aphelenchoides fujianensis]